MTVNGVMLPTHGHTDGRGQYTVYCLQAGTLRVRVIATGFNVTESKKSMLRLGRLHLRMWRSSSASWSRK